MPGKLMTKSVPSGSRRSLVRAAGGAGAPAVIALALALSSCRAETTAPQKEEPAATSTPAATSKPGRPAGQTGAESWNGAQIDWQPYEAGLAKAKAEGKPVCLILSTVWCPHCKNFSKVFDDARVVERAKDFVMIRLDADADSDIARQYAKDGAYVPRTFFLAADGTPDYEIHAPRPKYMYFYDEHDPSSLLAGMEKALQKLRK